jgi:hypothetical protein
VTSPAKTTPVVKPVTNITLSGAETGQLSGITTTCNNRMPWPATGQPGAPTETTWITVTGNLNGHSVELRIYDPSGPGNFEGGYVNTSYYVTGSSDNPVAGRFYGWSADDKRGVSEFGLSTGATVHTAGIFNLQQSNIPDTSGTPYTPTFPDLTVDGRVIC